MKYVRTRDNIYEVKNDFIVLKSQELYLPHFQDIITKQADTIEELICDDDILYIDDLYPDAVLVVEGNIKPFGYLTAIKLKEWLDGRHKFKLFKPKFDLFIKDSKGNYIKRATTNEKGKLELL